MNPKEAKQNKLAELEHQLQELENANRDTTFDGHLNFHLLKRVLETKIRILKESLQNVV